MSAPAELWYPVQVHVGCLACSPLDPITDRMKCRRCHGSGIATAYACRAEEWHATTQGARECQATVARGELVTP